MKKKLSETQLALLCIIDEATVLDGDVVRKYWVPHDRRVQFTRPNGTHDHFYILGAGCVAALKALAARGLTRSQNLPHSYSVTEAGRIYLENLRAAFR